MQQSCINKRKGKRDYCLISQLLRQTCDQVISAYLACYQIVEHRVIQQCAWFRRHAMELVERSHKVP